MLKDIINEKFVLNRNVNEQDDSYDLYRLVELTKTTNYERFCDVLNRIQLKHLYKSKTGNLIHGQNHVERVLFYSNLLAIFNHLNDTDYKILMDAAAYHDSGRTNDYDDNFHGYQSAILLEAILKKDLFYQQEENMNLIKAIVDFHCKEDSQLESILQYYKITDKQRAKKLAFLLKDADALDRVRFLSSEKWYLDEKLLRNTQSRFMINAAKELVGIYQNPIINHYKKIIEVIDDDHTKIKVDPTVDEKNVEGCFHGIGWDFFKLDSILKYGILSPKKCKGNEIQTCRNFLSPMNNYIYVIADFALGKETNSASAIDNFIHQGISFYSIVPKLVEGLPYTQKEEAIEQGLPYTKGEYADESFVKENIPIQCIEYVLLDEDKAKLKLDQLDYFNCNRSSKIIKEKAEYYLQNLKEKLGYDVNDQEIKTLTAIYDDVVIASNEKKDAESLNRNTTFIKDAINQRIGEYMQEAYSHQLGEEANVGKVIEYIVGKRRENYKVMQAANAEVLIKVK